MKSMHLKKTITAVIIVFFVNAPHYLKAQTALNIGDCIHLAIQNSYQLQSDSLLSESLKMMVKQEQSAYYPQISGSAGISGLFLSPYTFGQHYLQAVADWDLGRFWYKTADLQQKQVEKNEALMQQNELEITGLITGLYLDVLQNQLDLQILQSQLDYLNNHIKILEVLWKAGTIQQLDILQTQSLLNAVKEEWMQKKVGANQIQYAMARLMGLESSDALLLSPISGELPSPEKVMLVSEGWFKDHPLAIQFQKEYESELLRKKNVKASFSPHLQAFSGYSVDNDPTGDGNYMLLGLGASIPVFSWKKKDYQLQEVEFKAESIQKQKQNAERNLSIQFGQLVQQIEQYKELFAFQKEKILTDREVSKVAELNYQAGISTHLDFITAQQTLTETELKMNTVRYQYLKSVLAMWLLTGQTENVKNLK